jgi:hypothetical protein
MQERSTESKTAADYDREIEALHVRLRNREIPGAILELLSDDEVGQQQQSDAANRNLAIRQLLTTLGQQQNQDLASFYADLSGQGNQRDIASAGLGVDLKKLQESQRQFGLSNYLQGLQVQNRQEQLDAANGPFNAFLKTLGAASGVAQGVGTSLSAYSALTAPKGGGTVPAPPTPRYFPSSQTWP